MKQQRKKLFLPLLCILLCYSNQKTQAINPLVYSFAKEIISAQKASIAMFCIQRTIKKMYYESLSQSEKTAEKTSLTATTLLTQTEQKNFVARIIKKRALYEEVYGKEKAEKLFSLVSLIIDNDKYISHELETTQDKLAAYALIVHNNSKAGYLKRAINWTISTGIFMLHTKYGPKNKTLCLATFLGTCYITSIIEGTIASYGQEAFVKKYIQKSYC